jgi:hypothetical protein
MTAKFDPQSIAIINNEVKKVNDQSVFFWLHE